MISHDFLKQHHYHKVDLELFSYEVNISDIDALLFEIADLKAKLEAMERALVIAKAQLPNYVALAAQRRKDE